MVDRLLEHALQLVFGEAVGRLHLDGALEPGAHVGSGDAQNPVGVDQERHLEPRHAGRQRRDGDLEAREAAVVGRQLPLALEHVDVHRRLAVDRGGERLLDARRDRRVAVDETREHAAHGLDAQRQRHDVEEEHVPPAAREDAGLDTGAQGHDLVRVDVDQRRPAEDLVDLAADERDARRAAHRDDLADVTGLDARVLERLAARRDGARDDVADQALELFPADGGAGLAADLGQLERDLGPLDRGELLLGAFGGGARPRPHGRPRGELRRQLGEDHLGQPRVEVVAAKTGVAVRGQHLEDPAAELQDGDVEGAAPEVVDRDRPLLALVEPVGERRRGRLVHEAQHLEACEPPGVLGRLALAVVEVRRHRDHGLADGAPERVLGPALELAQDERRHLGRRHLTALDHETDHTPAPLHEAIPPAILVAHVLEAETHEALHGEDRLEGTIGRELARPPPDDHLAAGQEGDGRRQEPRAGLGFGQHPRAVLAEHGHEAVGGAEINADDPLHSRLPAPTRCRRAASAGMRSRRVAA